MHVCQVWRAFEYDQSFGLNSADNFSIQSFAIELFKPMEKYKKIKHLGEGSFGTVYLVQDGKGRKYAMKKITKMNAFVIDDAVKEIKVMEKLLHPNLIRVYDSQYHQEAEQLEIVMEYCEGGDLLHYYSDNNKSLKVPEILFIFRQIVKAFIALNVKGIMHRDLKPQNVLLKQEMTGLVIKIADFGCARNLTPEQISKIDNFTLATGTPIYASPQLLQNQPYSSKCDVWSGGCLLYLLSFGQHPVKDTTVEKTLIKIKSLTQNKEIAVPNNADPTIRQLIKLSLVYQDKERASWRELWLHRFFNPKVNDMASFIQYLRSISNISNWIIKQFWKLRKSLNITPIKNEVFAYFIVKFQYNNIIMAQEITRINPAYEYLFTQGTYKPLKINQKELLNELNIEVESYKNFFEKIKATLSSKQAFNMIQQKQMQRRSGFADLDHSIRAAYRILLEATPNFEKMQNQNQTIEFVWLIMARWLNFEFWFSYERKPRVENFLKESFSTKNIFKQIQVEMQKYNYGVVQ